MSIQNPADAILPKEAKQHIPDSIPDQMKQLIFATWKWAEQNGQDFESFVARGCRAATMYNSVHSFGGPSHREMDREYYSNPEYENFNEEIEAKLVRAATDNSKVRQITPKELIEGGQPDQAEHFVWFKGNYPRPNNSREARFYINAKPEGVTEVAEILGKLSDYCDQHNMRLQFKFRKDLEEYDRSDTCVVYLYLPSSTNREQQQHSDGWVKTIGSGLANHLPVEALRPNTSLFIERLGKGVGFTDDNRTKESKKSGSFTSEITNTMGKVSMDLANDGIDASNQEVVLNEIVSISIKKLRDKGYTF